MGGSALVGDFLYYFKINHYAPLAVSLPIFTHRSYDLPVDNDQNTLVICVSYSGNTEETVSAFKKARQENLEIAGITSGGQLAELFSTNKTPWVKIPKDIPPRLSFGYQLTALTKILMGYGLLNSSANNVLSELSQKITPGQTEKEAKLFCERLRHKIPIIYASEKNHPIARIWKINFNENTKIPAFYNYFPELNHNEMVGWTNNFGPFYFLFLQDDQDLPIIQKRMKLTAQLLKQNSLPAGFIHLTGANPLEKLFRSLLFGAWLSYHLAIFYGLDPTPVEMVEEFKKLLKD